MSIQPDETSDAEPAPLPPSEPDRRAFLGWLSTAAMACGMAAGYGMFAYMAGRFVYPAKPAEKKWMFVSQVQRIRPGAALEYQTPTGEKVTIARQGSSGAIEDFIALSSICPHLGCAVHWEQQNNRFFCPCHNGVFDPQGKGTGGPPGDAGQSLPRFPLKIENELLFIQVELDALNA